jgi:Ca-activated chloride channel homolog
LHFRLIVEGAVMERSVESLFGPFGSPCPVDAISKLAFSNSSQHWTPSPRDTNGRDGRALPRLLLTVFASAAFLSGGNPPKARVRPTIFETRTARLLNNQSSQTLTSESSNSNVTLFAHVTDKKGVPVTDLKESEIHIFEDGVEQKIVSFKFDTLTPTILGILVDISGSRQVDMKAQEKELDALSDFVGDALPQQDEAYITAFNEKTYAIAALTRKPDELKEGIQRLKQVRPLGETRLLDSIYSTSAMPLPDQSARRALLVLSDFDENSSKHSLDDTIQELRFTNTQLYCLVDGMSVSMEMSKKSRKNASEVSRELCEETGGLDFRLESMDSLRSALEQVKLDLRGFYVVAYQSANNPHDRKRRKLKVKVSRKDVRVITSEAYVAPRD